MLKLLIADDEYLVIESLKMVISKNIADINIVGTANTGREAIEKAIELKPDIIFMDIHMPGIDGMEAIKQIRSSNKDAAFIIITAYDFFDYAKEAINLGVSEYLLKPINKNKVLETLEKLKVDIYEKRKIMLREVELKERINRILPFLENQFISHYLFNSGTVRDIEFYEDVFEMKLNHGYAITILLNSYEGKHRADNLKLSIEKHNLYDTIKLELKRMCSCIIGNPLLDRIIAFVPEDSATDSYEIRNKAIKTAHRLIDKAKSNSMLKYRIGIGRKYSVEGFNKSCNEAYIAATIPNGQKIMHFEDVSPSNRELDNYPENREVVFTNKILSGNLQEAKEVFNEIYAWLAANYNKDVDRIKTKLIDLIFLAEKSLPVRLNKFSSAKQDYILRILKSNDKDELKGQLISYLCELNEELEDSRKNEISGIIPNVLKYIDKNLYKNITLNDAAKSVNLSYHYFSKIFKEEVGKNFVDYLTEVRIEKSIKLLRNNTLSIKEICHKIGYNDPNYYCKIFKKITGLTPTEYRSTF